MEIDKTLLGERNDKASCYGEYFGKDDGLEIYVTALRDMMRLQYDNFHVLPLLDNSVLFFVLLVRHVAQPTASTRTRILST